MGRPWLRCGWCDCRVYVDAYSEIITRPAIDSPRPHEPGRIPACESCAEAWLEIMPSAGPNCIERADNKPANRLKRYLSR